MVNAKYLIIGNSAGGIGCAEAIREIDSTGSIIIVASEPYHTYSRVLISKYLSKERSFTQMLYRDTDFYSRNNIEFYPGESIASLIMSSHLAVMENGMQIVWEKLLLAVGGIPIIPRIDGITKKGVFTFTKLDDAKAIDSFLKENSKAVVIGGGLIGVSVTEAMVKRGIQVTIVEMKDRILNTVLDEHASSMLEEKIQYAGVRMVTGRTVIRISGDTEVQAVILDNGENIACDLVVFAIGVYPSVDLIKGTPAKINRGILVDRHMETNIPGVFACGDVAEAYDFIYDSNRVNPIWPGAYMGGRISGLNMAGKCIEYGGNTGMNTINYFGVTIASAGMLVPPDSSYEVLSKKSTAGYQKFILKDNKLVGILLVGVIEKCGILLSMMRERLDMCGFKEEIMNDTFGLFNLPEDQLQKRLEYYR